MTNKFEYYYDHVSETAKDFMDEYFNGFIGEIVNGDTDSYGMLDNDGKLHEFIDQEIDLREAVEILEQSNNVETDSGLWDSQEPLDAISTMAFYTFRNDVNEEIVSEFRERLEAERDKRQEAIDEAGEEDNIDSVQEEVDNIEEAIDNL